MTFREFRRAGHLPTLACAFLYFDMSFMVWVILGPLLPAIREQIPMSPSEKGFLLAVPILFGAVMRLILGVAVDRWGAKRVGVIGQVLTLIPLCLGWLWADTYFQLIIVGLLLGIAGASFAAALPLAGRWYPPQQQGLALGIAGAGNSGTALATLFAPILARQFGWQAVFGLALMPMVASLILFTLFAKDAPNAPPPKPLLDYFRPMRHPDALWFCGFYAITFGGFVGLASFLNVFFVDQYDVDKIRAGHFATICVIAGSFLRPVGGFFADRIGGARMLQTLFVGVSVAMFGVAMLPHVAVATALLAIGMGMLGMGNGAVFQLLPQRFSREMGAMTGLVGAAGGIGGFLLPNLLGTLKQTTGSYGTGIAVFAATALVGALAIWAVARAWRVSSAFAPQAA
jgi:MFS transporter, NNP family, nitrate/nitrite transporter